MPAPATRAQDIAERLAAAEVTPRVTHHSDHIRIEADVPESLSEERWKDVLAALASADRFGDSNGTGQHTVWAVVRTAGEFRVSDGRQPACRETDGPEEPPERPVPPGGWPSAVRS